MTRTRSAAGEDGELDRGAPPRAAAVWDNS